MSILGSGGKSHMAMDCESMGLMRGDLMCF